MELKNFFPQDPQGNVIPGATVYLYLPGTTTLATGLKNADGTPLANPFTADVTGKAAVAAPDGDYDLRIVGAGRDSTMRVRFIDSDTGSANVLRQDLASTASGKGAALVGFKQAGAGAADRTAQEKSREKVSLRDFGAVGGGVVDDTAAIQAAINAYPSNTILDGGGLTYKITATLKIPNNSRFLTLRNANLAVAGDILALSSSAITDLISFFTLESCIIDASGHTTAGRAAINFSCFSQSTFKDVWIFGAAGKTVGFYGTCTNGGAGPYYDVWDHCYFGGTFIGIHANDAPGVPETTNSNTVTNCRFQPGAGNFGVYIGNNNQNWRIIDSVFEAIGGTGIHNNGIGCKFTGNRFESMTVGISYLSSAYGCFDAGNYFDSCTTNRTLAGDSSFQNTIFGSSTALTGITNTIQGNTQHNSVGAQNTVSAFGKDFGTGNSCYTSGSNLPPSASWRHFSGLHTNGGGVSYIVYGNGNVVNTNNSYGAISDAKLKENIEAAPSYWDKFKRYEFVNYTLVADEEKRRLLGVVAQQIETVSSGLVDETPDIDEKGNDLGTTTKSVKYSVIALQAEVVLQEAQKRIESLELEVEWLALQLGVVK